MGTGSVVSPYSPEAGKLGYTLEPLVCIGLCITAACTASNHCNSLVQPLSKALSEKEILDQKKYELLGNFKTILILLAGKTDSMKH